MWWIEATLSPSSNNSINKFLSISLLSVCKNKHKSWFLQIFGEENQLLCLFFSFILCLFFRFLFILLRSHRISSSPQPWCHQLRQCMVSWPCSHYGLSTSWPPAVIYPYSVHCRWMNVVQYGRDVLWWTFIYFHLLAWYRQVAVTSTTIKIFAADFQ